MASSSSPRPIISFGTETELALLPKDGSLCNEKTDGNSAYDKCAKLWNEEIRKRKLNYRTMCSRDPRDMNNVRENTEFIICNDAGIDLTSLCLRDPSFFGCEIISPINYMNKPECFAELKFLFDVFLPTYYFVVAHDTCSTHIHVSTTTGFSLDDAKKHAICVIALEPAILALLPEHRHGHNGYVKSNWASNDNYGAIPSKATDDVESVSGARDGLMEQLAHVQQVDEIFRFINPDQEKDWAWNYRNLISLPEVERLKLLPGNRPLGTVEWRQPPISLTFKELVRWIQFVVSFTDAAMLEEDPFETIAMIAPTIGKLREFVENERLLEGPNLHDLSRMEDLWRGKSEDAWVMPKPYGRLVKADNRDAVAENLEKEREDIESLVSEAYPH